MKIHTEEMMKEGFDDLSIAEVREMVGFVEPSDDADTWEVTTIIGGFTCKNQETAEIISGLEQIKAKLFG